MSDARAGVYERISREIRRRKAPERPFVLGVTGIDGAGKTRFAAGLETYLRERGREAVTVHLDGYHQPAAVRAAARSAAASAYRRAARYRPAARA